MYLSLKQLLSFFVLILVIICQIYASYGMGEVVFAVNAGGQEHVDIHGVRYQSDRLRVGTPSDHGKNLNIQRVPLQDAILYQTERYHVESFSYEVPIEEDGDYVLVLKFSEVWFRETGQKVFDVVLNDDLTVVPDLDIFDRVGLGVAHDEIIPFTVSKGKLKASGDHTSFGGTLVVEFVKGQYDNPKVNAILVVKGKPDDIPKLPPLPWQSSAGDDEDDDNFGEDEDLPFEEREAKKEPKGIKYKSGPKTVDPYSADDSRIRDLMRAGVVKKKDRPMWFDVMKAFPPITAPAFEQTIPDKSIQEILYPEDVIRAQFYKEFGNIQAADLNNHESLKRSPCQRFINKYQELEASQSVALGDLFEETVNALAKEGFELRKMPKIEVKEEELTEEVPSLAFFFQEAIKKREAAEASGTKTDPQS